MSGYWGELAREHWQRHLPDQYAALEDPDEFFALLDEEASDYYLAIRDGFLQGIRPTNGDIHNVNSGPVTWADFLDRVAGAHQTAHEIVATEMIYIPGDDNDDDPEDPWDTPL